MCFNGKFEIGFFKDYWCMNVVMICVCYKLVIIGDSVIIGGDVFYVVFLEYCD